MAFPNKRVPIFGQDHKSSYIPLLEPSYNLSIYELLLKKNGFVPKFKLLCISYAWFYFLFCLRNEVRDFEEVVFLRWDLATNPLS